MQVLRQSLVACSQPPQTKMAWAYQRVCDESAIKESIFSLISKENISNLEIVIDMYEEFSNNNALIEFNLPINAV